jgi:hypothetical protein
VLTFVVVVEPRAFESRLNSVLQTAHRNLVKSQTRNQRVLQQQNSISAVDETQIITEVISKLDYPGWLEKINWAFGDAKSSVFSFLLAPLFSAARPSLTAFVFSTFTFDRCSFTACGLQGPISRERWCQYSRLRLPQV